MQRSATSADKVKTVAVGSIIDSVVNPIVSSTVTSIVNSIVNTIFVPNLNSISSSMVD